MKMINHEEAIALEMLIRYVYNCKRGGVMGIADADHLEYFPLDAALVLFAPLYKTNKDIPEIDEFVEKYLCLFDFPEDYEYEEQKIDDYITQLKQLVNKYY